MIMFDRGDAAALTACSDLLSEEAKGQVNQVCAYLQSLGLEPRKSSLLYGTALEAKPREKAAILNQFYRDRRVRVIFDVSGGNASNELLPYLDYEAAKREPKLFWGYSDCTALLNAIYAETGNPGVLWQIRNLAKGDGNRQKARFQRWIEGRDSELFQVNWQFRQGSFMEGILVGGNLRCFLKLAGTPYFPDLEGKLLFLEGLSGSPAFLASLLSQLAQTGAFNKISGLLLGTFTELESRQEYPDIFELLLRCGLPERLPVAATGEVGHGADAKALWIGKMMSAGVKR